MFVNCLKIATTSLALTVAAASAERTNVLIHGTATSNNARKLAWTLCENGRISSLGGADAYKVPADRYLVIHEVAFTVKSSAIAVRAVNLKVVMKAAGDTLDLAQVTDKLLARLDATTITKRFTPGLVVASGAEVWGALQTVQPGGTNPTVDVTFYGFLVPNGQGW